MATPTITSITPVVGPTRGRRIVKIAGTNFRLRPSPVAAGPTRGTIKEAVRVFFGDTEAVQVAVFSPTALTVVTPPHKAGAVSVRIVNVDQDGVRIGTEEVTATNAYTFAMPNFSRIGANESILARVVRAFVELIQTQLIENVALSTHADYDGSPDGAFVAELSKLPGLAIGGPTTRTNRFLTTNEKPIEERGSDVFQQKPPRVIDLLFSITGVHNLGQATMNFMQEVIGLFEDNKHLHVLRNPSVPGVYSKFEMDIEKDFAAVTPPDGNSEDANSNIHSFTGIVVVRGVPLSLDDMAESQVFTVNEVIPTGSAMPSAGVIFVGQPGVTLASPLPQNPPAQVGNTGPFEQLTVEDEEDQ